MIYYRKTLFGSGPKLTAVQAKRQLRKTFLMPKKPSQQG